MPSKDLIHWITVQAHELDDDLTEMIELACEMTLEEIEEKDKEHDAT